MDSSFSDGIGEAFVVLLIIAMIVAAIFGIGLEHFITYLAHHLRWQ